ncbi:sugar transferase [Luteolibacter ambystomatis]|uniref:Sugar transferase n=1 Tax=Luteolibacter ambystomatis TaxID=2824561 RepID=A0A975G762_9BACT|nr:sugar transferase [Luteolibacter ambystomatis]QUE50208.1 sugar transferase [Luteolibacter ambystomatis]
MPANRRQSFSIQVLQLVDAMLIWAAFAVGALLREPLIDWLDRIGVHVSKNDVSGLKEITWLLFIVVPFAPLALELFGFYRSPVRQRFGPALWQVIKAFTILAIAISVMVVFFRFNASSRAVLAMAIPLAVLFLMTRAWLVSNHARHASVAEDRKESIVLAGSPADIDQWLREVPEDESVLWRIVGRHDLTTDDWKGFQRLLEDEAVERVVFAAKSTAFDKLGTAIEICESRGIEAWVAASFIQTQVARPTFDMIGGRPLLVLRSTPDLSWELLAKGVLDWLGAVFLLILTAPLWLVVAIAIKIQSPGPVFYFQERAGRYGKPFRMWKFRTMIPDADRKLEELKQQSGNQMSGPVFKLENDPRIFPVGRLLRKYSIDELPQFINVARGEMSLVGPRPMAMYELPKIENSAHRRKLSVKPGLTCIWQVSGRNEITSFDEWVKLDLQYIDNWSLWLDIKILAQTIPAVLLAKGAK